MDAENSRVDISRMPMHPVIFAADPAAWHRRDGWHESAPHTRVGFVRHDCVVHFAPRLQNLSVVYPEWRSRAVWSLVHFQDGQHL